MKLQDYAVDLMFQLLIELEENHDYDWTYTHKLCEKALEICYEETKKAEQESITQEIQTRSSKDSQIQHKKPSNEGRNTNVINMEDYR